MPRSRILDFMQSHRFWLFDLVPSLAPPFFVLGSPFLGFSSITAPEYTAEVDSIKQLNSMFKRYAYAGGEAGSMTLSRGVRGFDDSMWQWMYRALVGIETTPRNLLLLHYTSIRTGSLRGGPTFNVSSIAPGIQNPMEAGEFMPGKAWLLWDAIPIRYKAAGDFDALSGAVSISELDIQPSAFSEFTLLDPI